MQRDDPRELTSQRLEPLLNKYLQSISAKCRQQPQLVLAAWPKGIGEQFAQMSKAVRFSDGVLLVHVANSTLMSIVSRPSDRARLLRALQEQVPGIEIKGINFRVG